MSATAGGPESRLAALGFKSQRCDAVRQGTLHVHRFQSDTQLPADSTRCRVSLQRIFLYDQPPPGPRSAHQGRMRQTAVAAKPQVRAMIIHILKYPRLNTPAGRASSGLHV